MPVRLSRYPVKPQGIGKVNFQHPQAKGLKNFWLFNEGGGTVIHDLCGYSPGTLDTTITTWSKGAYGNGLLTAATGSGNIGVTLTGASRNYGNTWTWDSIIRFDGSDSYGALCTKNTNDGIFTRSGGNLSVYYSGDNLSTTTMVAGNYYHLLVTLNDTASVIDVYFNGVKDITFNTGGKTSNFSGLFNDSSSETFKGLCFYQRIWARYFTQAEVHALYQNPYAILDYYAAIPAGIGSAPAGGGGLLIGGGLVSMGRGLVSYV